MNDSRDPAAQVEEYLDLLASGKAQAASKLVSPGVDNDALLTDEVLGAAEERLLVRSVETVERDAEGARVIAQLSLAGEEFEREFTVDHGDNEMLVLETWELNDPLVVEATVALTGPVSAGNVPAAVDFAGTEVLLAETMTGADSTTVWVYPGVYPVAAGDLGTYLEGTSQSLTTRLDGSLATVELSAFLNEAFEAEILSQATSYADGCVSIGGNSVVTSNMDAACPSITRNTRLSELRVLKYPSSFSGIDAKYFTTDSYEFEVRSSSASARLDTAHSSLSGSISWRDGKPSIVDASFSGW
ncbi:hypothetical protein JOF28_001765 [Leucobacter exalbidus]|uniref:Uncharacterized protein n=1 Tax=Leucobacter exalbidus TaxID=662960 RepID=A0A940PTI5_9MICO|nr:hypothetical protein [Leucobacter exalbidus]MBP1326533.1 hypothetical protein [Leucobacter exalbidus]